MYFDFDYCDVGLSTYCARYPDDLSVRLHEYLMEKLLTYGEENDEIIGEQYLLTEAKLDELGIYIYFKNFKIESVYYDTVYGGTIEMYLKGTYEMENIWGTTNAKMVFLRDSGEFFNEA